MSNPDRRKHPRKRACFLALFRQLNNGRKPSTPQPGYTTDISTGGLFLITPIKLKKKRDISLTIYPSGEWMEWGSLPKFEVKGKIVKVDQLHKNSSPSRNLNRVAVQFTEQPILSLC